MRKVKIWFSPSHRKVLAALLCHLFIKKSITFIIFFLYQVQIKYPTNNLSFTDISQSEVQEKEVIVGIVTDIDLLHHVSQKESRSGSSSGGNFLVN